MKAIHDGFSYLISHVLTTFNVVTLRWDGVSCRLFIWALCVPFIGHAQGWLDTSTWHEASKGSVIRHASDGRIGTVITSTAQTEVEPGFWSTESYILFRERGLNGNWSSPELVVSGEEEAVLFYDAENNPLVFVFSGGLSLYRRNHGGTWSVQSSGGSAPFWSSRVAAAQDYNGHVHFAVYYSDSLYWERWDGVSWQRDKILDIPDGNVLFSNNMETVWDVDSTEDLRNVAIAADRDGKIHIVYGVRTLHQPISGGTRIRSELRYVTNRGGSWSAPETLLSHGSGWGDAGTGASIAAAPDGTLAVAATFLPRAQTGSPGRASLEYLHQSPGGGWVRTMVSNTSDNYRDNDGERGTGMHPQLVFDEFSRPHIVFTDHASGHFSGFGAQSFSGQVRYATRNSPVDGPWSLQTLVGRGGTPAADFLSFAPAVSAARGQVAVSDVSYRWNATLDDYERVVSNPILGIFDGSDPGAVFTGGGFGQVTFSPVGPRTYAFSESLGAWLLNGLQGVRSHEYGALSAAGDPGWLISSHYGFVHFGATGSQYGGWVWSERFNWMKFESAGSERYLWVPMMNSWMSVNADGTFFSFEWRHITPQGMNRYHSSVFGGLTTGDFGGWVASDRFGWMWANGDGVWFWSESRQEWLGVTPEGGIWSTAENQFI
jgi:hypothetical protein